MTENKTFKLNPGATKAFIYIATIVNLMLWFDYLEQMLYACCDDGFYLYFTFIIISGILFLLSAAFYRIASVGAKIVMYLCYAFIVFNVFLGVLNKYWDRELVAIEQEEDELLIKYVNGALHELPSYMEILHKTDSFTIIGKPVKRINKIDFTASNLVIPDSLNDEDSLYFRYVNNQIIPLDFRHYFSLISKNQNSAVEEINQFYEWAYPDYMVFGYKPNCPSYYYIKNDREIHIPFFYFSTFETYRKGSVINFSWELFHGELPKRYQLFFGKFRELFFPTYVSTQMINDPYFLIFKGKYKEAREGLIDLPPARRVFCEKKLEALGY